MKLFGIILFLALFSVPVTYAYGLPSDPIYKEVVGKIDPSHLQKLLKDMTGENTVTVNGRSFTISNRYGPAAKENFRAYWKAYFDSINIPVTELPYPTRYTEQEA